MNITQQHRMRQPSEAGESLFSRPMTRAAFVRQLAIAAGVTLVGCTPVSILLKTYPAKFRNDDDLVDRVLRAFVTTVIPGAPEDDHYLTRIFHDEYYPFYSLCPFFTSDLCSRSARTFGEERFEMLSLSQRTAIVKQGLSADPVAARMYRGAVFMAQVSFYCGIYDDEHGCALIGFDGRNSGFRREEMCYTNNVALLAREATTTGNLN